MRLDEILMELGLQYMRRNMKEAGKSKQNKNELTKVN